MSKCALTIVLAIIAVACNPNKTYAPDRNFYFEVLTQRNNDSTAKLASYIKEQIPEKKYTITNQSGLIWPFYKELDLNEKILKDSLMPPHWFVHRMIPLRKDYSIRRDEYLVLINVDPQADTIPNYSVEIFKMDSTGLTLSGQSGVHYLDSTEFSSLNSLREVYLKSIIRYSFK